MKNPFDGFISRLDIAKEIINEVAGLSLVILNTWSHNSNICVIFETGSDVRYASSGFFCFSFSLSFGMPCNFC